MSYRTLNEIVAAFNSLEQTYPSLVSHEQIGTSVQGRPIYVWKIGPSWGGKVLWTGCCHGGETINPEILLLYAKWLLEQKEPAATDILAHNNTIILPILNVDGYAAAIPGGAWARKNAHGVDLNRNTEAGWCGGSSDPTSYAYKGVSALSEVEDQAFHSFVQREKPVWHCDLHTGSTPIYKDICDPAKIQRRDAALNQYVQLCIQRGVTSYPFTTMGFAGRLADCTSSHGSISLLWEFHPTEVNYRDNNPVFTDIETVWFPKFLPMAIVLSADTAVIPQPQQNLLFLVALSVLALAL